jgi:tetratricopeptide (TPR) repeat protein
MLVQIKELDEAIQECRKAIELNPEFADTYFALGAAFAAKSELDEAIAAYRTAIAKGTSFREAHFRLGVALAEKGQLDDAIDAYRKAIDLNLGHAATHFRFGLALAEKQRDNDAIAEYRAAIAHEPHHLDAHCNLGLPTEPRTRLRIRRELSSHLRERTAVRCLHRTEVRKKGAVAGWPPHSRDRFTFFCIRKMRRTRPRESSAA